MSKENKKYIDEQIDALLRQKPDIVVSREELKKQFDSRETLDEFIAYVKGLNHLTEDFDQLMNEIKAKIQVFQEQHPCCLSYRRRSCIERYPWQAEYRSLSH